MYYTLAILFFLSCSDFTLSQDAITNITFEMSEYTFTEGQSLWCLEVRIVGTPATEDFLVDYEFDPSLSGHPGGGSRHAVLEFLAGNSVQPLCFAGFDNEVACEQDVKGSVRLSNSTTIQAIQVAIATVTIEDDEVVAVNIGFTSSVYVFAEDSGMQQVFVDLGTDNPSPITLQITGDQSPQSSISRFFPPLGSELTINTHPPRTLSFNLTIIDDLIGLEDPEEVTLMLSVTAHLCRLTQMSSFNQTVITILDNEVSVIELVEDSIAAHENETSVEVCVQISTEIARPLNFSLMTHNGSAKDGEDYIGGIFKKQFEEFSSVRMTCIQIPILEDGVVENTDTFTVSLHVETTSGELTIGKSVTTVIIHDSSHCVVLKLLEGNTAQQVYVPPLSSVCFTCMVLHKDTESHINVTWSISGHTILSGDGETLSNGMLMIRNSSQTFNSAIETSVECNAGNSKGLFLKVVLGAAPKVLSLLKHLQTTDQGLELILTCTYDGAPLPTIAWLFEGSALPTTPDIVIHTSKSSSVLTIIIAAVTENDVFGNYSCIATNMFGSGTVTIEVYSGEISSEEARASTKPFKSRGILQTAVIALLLWTWL